MKRIKTLKDLQQKIEENEMSTSSFIDEFYNHMLIDVDGENANSGIEYWVLSYAEKKGWFETEKDVLKKIVEKNYTHLTVEGITFKNERFSVRVVDAKGKKSSIHIKKIENKYYYFSDGVMMLELSK